MDKLEFLDGAEAPNEEVQPEAKAPEAAPAEPATEAAPERARGPHGRFVAKEAPAPVAATPEAPAASTVPEPAPEQPMVPLAALHETRDKVRDLEAQLAALKPKAQPQPQVPQAPPDVFEDPDGFSQWQQQQIANVRLNISEEMARDKFGDELVDAARDWATAQFQANPAFAQEVLSQRHPYAYAVKVYQKQQSLSQLGDDPTEIQAFLAWKQAQSAQPAAQAAQPQPAPPKSIAAAPSAGGVQHTAVGPGVAFDNMIGT